MAGASSSTCVLLSTLDVKCWGDNSVGQLGQGHTNDLGDEPNELGDYLPPVNMGVSEIVMELYSFASSCVLLGSGSLKCFGSNGAGQLGYGDSNHRGDAANEMGDYLPYLNLGTGLTVTNLDAGFGFMVSVLDDNSLKTWGINLVGLYD